MKEQEEVDTLSIKMKKNHEEMKSLLQNGEAQWALTCGIPFDCGVPFDLLLDPEAKTATQVMAEEAEDRPAFVKDKRMGRT